jgi:hypothetical protein
MTDIIDELFLMVNLGPPETGLPMVIWAGPSYGAPHRAQPEPAPGLDPGVRIKVMQTHGMRMDPHILAVVGVCPQPPKAANLVLREPIYLIEEASLRSNRRHLVLKLGNWAGPASLPLRRAGRLNRPSRGCAGIGRIRHLHAGAGASSAGS